MFRFGIGVASPSISLSTPAMMRIRVDLPEPFRPSRPILAPGKNDSEMSFRIWRLGGTILPTRFMVKTYWAICGFGCLEVFGGVLFEAGLGWRRLAFQAPAAKHLDSVRDDACSRTAGTCRHCTSMDTGGWRGVPRFSARPLRRRD